MNILRIICLLAGIVCTILFLLPLITFRILNIGNATGLFIGLLLMICGLFLKQILEFVRFLRKSIWGKSLLFVVGGGMIFCLLSAVIISFFMIQSVHQTPTGDVPLLVLGCRVKGTRPSLMLTERLETARKYLNAHETTVCILSGGKGGDEAISEAECMYRYLTEHGIEKDRLLLEDQSTSTRENLQFSLAIMKERNLGNTIAIVTNEFHEYRAFQIAEKLELHPYAVAAPTHWWLFPTYLVREWYGVIYEVFKNIF